MRISDWSSDVCSSDLRTADTVGDGAFGYESHYCAVDRSADPTALACGYFQSGVRVFNVVDPLQPYEIAYYNPPAQTGKGLSLQHSLHAWIGGLLPPISDLYTSDSGASADTVATDARYVGGFVAALPGLLAAAGSGPVSGNLSADWCSSPPRFVGNQLWVTCMDNGFMALQRSEEHTSELQSLIRTSYALFCLKKKQHITEAHIKAQ